MKTFYSITKVVTIINLFILSLDNELMSQDLALNYTFNTEKHKKNSNHLEKAKNALEAEDLDAFWKHIKQARLNCPCKYKTYFLKGVAHVKSEKLDRAEILFEMALKNAESKGENLDTILYSIAQVYAMEGKYDAAMEYINRTTDNIGGQGYYKRGLINMKSGNYEQAIAQFLTHIRIQITQPKEVRMKIAESKFNLGICHLKLQNYTIAEELLRESLSMEENLEARIALINLCLENGNREKAFSELKIAVKKHGKDNDSRNYLTNLLLNQVSVSDAVLNNLFRRSGESSHSSLTDGNIALRNKNYEDATEFYENAADSLGSLAANGLATVYLNQNEIQLAKEIWESVLEESPNDAIALEGLGIIEFLRGNLFVSKNYLTRAQQVDNYYQLSFDGLLCLGYINIELASYSEAIKVFTEGIQKSNKNKWAFAGIGYCKYEMYLYQEANEWFKKALKNDPTNPVFRGYMGVSKFWMSYFGGGRLGTKKYRSALNDLEYAFDSGISNPNIYNALAMCYSELGMLDKAERTIQEVCAIAPDNYEFWMNAGSIQSQIAADHVKQGKQEQARQALDQMKIFYEKAHSLGAPDDQYHTNLAYGYVLAEDYSKAKEIYNRLPENSSIRHNNLGVVYALEGNRTEAQMAFNQAYELEKESAMLKMVYDMNLSRSYSFLSRKNSFTSIYHFFLPMEAPQPELNHETNVPVQKVQPEMPEDEFQALLYDDKTLCEKQKKSTTIRVKETKKKHFTNCI